MPDLFQGRPDLFPQVHRVFTDAFPLFLRGCHDFLQIRVALDQFVIKDLQVGQAFLVDCLLYTYPSPRD